MIPKSNSPIGRDAHCQLPTFFSSFSELSTQHFLPRPLPTANCQLSSLPSQHSELSTQHFLSRQLPTANFLLFLLSTQHSALSFPSLSTSLPPGLSMPPQPLYRLSKFAVHRVRDSDCSSIPLCINYPSIIYYKINCLNKNKLIASTTIIPTHPSITHQLKIRPRKEHTSSTSGLHLHRTVLLSQYQQLLECSETPRPYSFLLLQTVPVKTH